MLYQHREANSTTSTLNEVALPTPATLPQQTETLPSGKVAIALQLISLDALLNPEQYLLETVVPHGGE